MGFSLGLKDWKSLRCASFMTENLNSLSVRMSYRQVKVDMILSGDDPFLGHSKQWVVTVGQHASLSPAHWGNSSLWVSSSRWELEEEFHNHSWLQKGSIGNTPSFL